MSEWRIHRREGQCARCERPFQEGEAMFSLLSLEADRLEREDRCPACFEDPSVRKAPPGAGGAGPRELLFWRTHHAADRRARFAVDFEAIEELFLGLEGGSLPELRYLLCLLLLRKKRLKLVGVRRRAGSETLCVRRPRRAEEFEVQVFELDSERAQALKGELARVFEGAGADALVSPGAGGHGGTPVGEADSATPA